MALVHVVDDRLDSLDSRQVEVSVAVCAGALRPLPEPLASIDWRMCGRVARGLRRVDFGQRPGETVLFSTEGRFGFRALLCAYGGTSEESIELAIEVACGRLEQLDVVVAGWAFAGWEALEVAVRAAYRRWDRTSLLEDVYLSVPRAAQREVRTLVEQEKRRKRIGGEAHVR